MSVEIENGLVWHALRHAGYLRRAQRAGVAPEDFDDAQARRAWSFVAGHQSRFGTLPGASEVSGIVGRPVVEVELDPIFCLDEMLNRKAFRFVRGKAMEIEAALRANRPREAFAIMKAAAESGGVPTSSHPTNLLEVGQEVVDLYQRVKDGYCGAPYPWPSLTDMTRGMWPGTVTMYVARPGVGKTFVAVISARHVWKHAGMTPLIISPEMDKVELAERFFVIESDVSYVDVVRAQLSDFAFDRLKDKATELRQPGQRPVWIMDPDDDLSPDSIDAAIESTRPDLVAIDSLYDLHIKAKDKRERLEAALSWARKSARKHNLPFVCFSQLNRESEQTLKRGGGARMGTVALTDQAGWDVYNLFALEQDQDMKADRQMQIKKLKLRRGFAQDDVVRCHWDFDEMRFDEVEERSRPAYQDTGWDPERGT